MSQWCHPTISSSFVPFSSYLQSFPASGSFQMSQLFASGGQSIGVSASTSVLPMNTQDWFPLGWTGWISLLSKGLSRVFSNTTVQKHQFFGTQAFFMTQLSHPYMTTGNTIALTRWTFCNPDRDTLREKGWTENWDCHRQNIHLIKSYCMSFVALISCESTSISWIQASDSVCTRHCFVHIRLRVCASCYFSCVWLYDPMDCQAPLSMGFFR